MIFFSSNLDSLPENCLDCSFLLVCHPKYDYPFRRRLKRLCATIFPCDCPLIETAGNLLWDEISQRRFRGAVHTRKISPRYFDDVASGMKPFEVRKEDESIFRAGDILILREFSDDYTGRTTQKRITYVLRGSEYCKDGYCILGLAPDNGKPGGASDV